MVAGKPLESAELVYCYGYMERREGIPHQCARSKGVRCECLRPNCQGPVGTVRVQYEVVEK